MKTLLELPSELKCFLEIGDAVIITDRTHHIIDVNGTYQAITSYEREKIRGLSAGFLKSKLTPESTYITLKKS